MKSNSSYYQRKQESALGVALRGMLCGRAPVSTPQAGDTSSSVTKMKAAVLATEFAVTKHLIEQFRRGRVYFGAQFKGSVCHGGEGVVAWTREGRVVTLHPQSRRSR